MARSRHVQTGLAVGLLCGAILGFLFAGLEAPFPGYTLAGNAMLIEALRCLLPGNLASLADRPFPLFLLYALSIGLVGALLGLVSGLLCRLLGRSPDRRERFLIVSALLGAAILFVYPALALLAFDLPERTVKPLWGATLLFSAAASLSLSALLSRLVPRGEGRIGGRLPSLLFVLLLLLLGISVGRTALTRRSSVVEYPGGGAQGAKVVLFAVDGVDWQLLRPMLDRGELPTLGRLIRDGSHGNLRTQLPPIRSPVVWTSIATSRLPDDHGLLDFVIERKDGGRLRPVTSRDVRKRTFWRIFAELGISTDLLSWYPSWPIEPIPGVMLSDRATYPKATERVFPADYDVFLDTLLAESRARLGDLRARLTSYRPEDDVDESGDEGPAALRRFDMHILDQSYIRDMVTVDFAKRLLREGQPDVMVVYFRGTDTVQHEFRKYHAARHDRWLASRLYRVTDWEEGMLGGLVESYARFVDEAMGEILDLVGSSTTILVLSDHGCGCSYDRLTHLPHDRLLRFLGWAEGDGKSADPARSMVHGFWDKAKTNHLRLLVNLQGRSRGGIVPRSRFPQLMEEMKERLVSLRTTSGRKVFSDVEVGRRAGTRASEGDLVLKVSSCAVGEEVRIGDSTLVVSEETARFSRSANHRMGGIVVVSGRGAAKGGKVRGATIYDITPTLFHLLGLPVALDWEGKVLLAALDEELRAGNPVQYVPTYEVGEYREEGSHEDREGADEKVMEELRALGYIR